VEEKFDANGERCYNDKILILRRGIQSGIPVYKLILACGEQKIKQQDVEEAWNRLEKTIQKCEDCSLCAQRTHAVPGIGDRNAVVMFVGEGPGAQEDKQGRPFVGRSGQFLTKVLTSIEVDRADVYITNVVKCRPPDNRDPLPAEIRACANHLQHQIDLIDPAIIVTLGRFSMQRWFSGEKITQIHGQVREIEEGRMALPMFHPAAALRNPKWRQAFEEDLQCLPDLIKRVKLSRDVR